MPPCRPASDVPARLPHRRTQHGSTGPGFRGLALRALPLALAWVLGEGGPGEAGAAFAGSAACAECHEAEASAWRTSQHRLAMQDATEATVLGDFGGATFPKDGVVTTFTREGGRFLVRTDGADGAPATFEVTHTFGVAPLQQYLVPFPGGRLQALSVAWDTKAGRWFHTYGDERIDHRDVLHWTRHSQNWNGRCAECHATALRKGYDPARDAFATTYVEQGVGCESCHGPGAAHVAWAKEGNRDAREVTDAAAAALEVDLDAARGREGDVCAPCHSLRSSLTASPPPVRDRFLDHYLPESLVAPDAYFDDGQQRGEVFILGSWQQSRMHAAGVRCSDCHDPHGGATRAQGDALCVGCHNASAPAAGPHIDVSRLVRRRYDTPEHHHHEKPVTCVQCHAPKRPYMVVDPRLDHSFRVPRPDVSAATGSPDACTTCHVDRDAAWAAAAVAKWYGEGRRREPHFGSAFHDARRGAPGAAEGLLRIAADASQPAVVRAGAVELLGAFPGRRAVAALVAAAASPEAPLRLAALASGGILDAAMARSTFAPLLRDPLRAVRVEAARAMIPLLPSLADAERAGWFAAAGELEESQRANADAPASGVGLAAVALAKGDATLAESELRRALRLEAAHVPARVNLADLLRGRGRDAEGEALLREGLVLAPRDPALGEALALLLVRAGRKGEALALLEDATRASPAPPPRLSWVLALALVDAGRGAEATALLDRASASSGDRDLLLALAAFRRDAGDFQGMQAALSRLAAINPDDPAIAVASVR